MDIHQTLNWRAIWPVLRTLPRDEPLMLLDAGCGNGSWCRRLARLRPQWRIVGVDRDPQRVREAQALASLERVTNVTYRQEDFMDGITGRYDVVLSIAAIHYAAAEGRGVDVLRRFASVLAPDGRLILLVPRREAEQPVWRNLPRPQSWPVFGVDELESMVGKAGLAVRDLRGLYGAWCVLAKQAALWSGGSVVRRAATAPLQALVRIWPFGLLRDPRRSSYALRAVVTAQ